MSSYDIFVLVVAVVVFGVLAKIFGPLIVAVFRGIKKTTKLFTKRSDEEQDVDEAPVEDEQDDSEEVSYELTITSKMEQKLAASEMGRLARMCSSAVESVLQVLDTCQVPDDQLTEAADVMLGYLTHMVDSMRGPLSHPDKIELYYWLYYILCEGDLSVMDEESSAQLKECKAAIDAWQEENPQDEDPIYSCMHRVAYDFVEQQGLDDMDGRVAGTILYVMKQNLLSVLVPDGDR